MKRIGCIVSVILSVLILWWLSIIWPYILPVILGPPKSNISYELNNNKYRIIDVGGSSNGRFTLFTYIKNSKKMTDRELLNFIKSFHYNRQIDSLYEMDYGHERIPYIMDTLGTYCLRIYDKNLRDSNNEDKPVGHIYVKLSESDSLCLHFRGYGIKDTCIVVN